jgi:hypothetical protein
MGCLVLLGCFSPFLPGLFFGTLLVQGLVVGGLLAARSSGYQKMRMGADWKTNSLWVHVDKQTRLTPDLNCVQDFTLVQRKRTTTTGTGLQKRTNTNYVYTLDALMSSGKAETVRGLPEMPKKKAEEVQRVARELLRRL